MVRIFIFITVVLVYVSCQQSEDTSTVTIDLNTSQSWYEETTEQSVLELSTNIDVTNSWQQETTEQSSLDLSTDGDNSTESWENSTNVTTQQQTPTISTTTCLPSITPDMLEIVKKEIINSIYVAISSEITSKLEAMEERLSTLTCSSNQPSTPIELDWQIYENLQIPLNGWLRVFDQPYSHKTRIDDLNQIAGICHKHVLVAATYNQSISLAAVGPASILKLNTTWNVPQQFGQVYWYRTNGKSFGFSPTVTIRQTSADNADLDSPLRLSWLLDQNMGGYRSGSTRSLADNSLWHKVIYCN
ncbi:unnamed protein product [Adineta steineri]|uniref:Uncharacterized protein n=1 Tax=Adineta steineri TaxID=433720 RepID=A0A815CDR2_9BILA|nr:unnamed protein product [Adineta steineri]